MGKRLYVGNIPFSATEEELREAFGAHGAVSGVDVIMDRETGRARGFAFIEVVSDCPEYYGRYNKVGGGADMLTWMAGRVCADAVVVTMKTLLLLVTGCVFIEHSTWAIERASGDIEGMALKAAVADSLGTTSAAEVAGAMWASGAVGTTAGASLTAGRVGTTCMAVAACV